MKLEDNVISKLSPFKTHFASNSGDQSEVPFSWSFICRWVRIGALSLSKKPDFTQLVARLCLHIFLFRFHSPEEAPPPPRGLVPFVAENSDWVVA